MRGEKSLLEWDTLLEKQAGSRESQALSQANSQFYCLKTEKIPTGTVALGDWLGGYRVGDIAVVQSPSHVRLFATPWTATHLVPLSLTTS